MSDRNPIEEVWDSLAGGRKRFVESFYRNLFERFPHYRRYFPDEMDPQMERMMDLIGAVARFSDHVDLVRPYLLHVGAAHKGVPLAVKDLRNFRDVFIETAASACGQAWGPRHAKAFQEAFDDTIIPIVYEGLNEPS